MIFVDASAMVALALNEPEARAIAALVDSGEPLSTSAIAIYEAAMAISRTQSISATMSHREVLLMVKRGGIRIVTLTEVTAYQALRAHEKYGKGNHPARLNMGDCFAYAAALAENASILFVGDDFTQTDLSNALYDI
jgi:ribonuclease VapC